MCAVCGERSDGAGSVDSFDSDEELSVGEEGSLKIDWEGWLCGHTITNCVWSSGIYILC